MTGNEWLPTWLRIVATVAYVVVLVVHLHHLLGNTRRGRAWHTAHLLMALGMIVMFLPTDRVIVTAAVGEAVFVVAAVGFGAFVAAELVRRGQAGAIWLFAAIDLAAMAYMFGMASTRLGWLTGLLVAWFVLQSLAWSTGRLNALADRGLDGPRAAPSVETTGVVGQPSSAETRLSAAVATTRRATAAPVHHAAKHSLSIRATLAVMSLGMAYMFVAMQLGMPQMSGTMPGM